MKRTAWVQAQDSLGQGSCDHRRRQVIYSRQQPIGVRQAPFTLVVELANDTRTYVLTPVVELFLELVLDHVALFFHHHNLFQTFGELSHTFSFQRPDHADLVKAQTDFLRLCFVDPKDAQGLAYVEIGLSRSDNANSCIRRIHDNAIEAVGSGIRQGGIQLMLQQALFLGQWWVGPADVQTPFRQRNGRDYRLYAMNVDIDDGRAFNSVRHSLEGDPAA